MPDEDIGLPLPRVPRVLKWLGDAVLALSGWKRVGSPEPLPKLIVLGVPHTSNWDFVLMLAVACSLGHRLSWAGKHTLFGFPLGPLMRALGGIPIDRRRSHGAVDQLVDVIRSTESIAVAIAPEGTRRRTEYWRSGFYHVARLADVPVVPGMLNYRTREAAFGPTLRLSGDIGRDMDQLRAFYAGCTGRFPEQFGPVRLRDETPTEQDSGDR
jgi:1-acyl-sn-glycerol-3-phosphate acyltransferase